LEEVGQYCYRICTQ